MDPAAIVLAILLVAALAAAGWLGVRLAACRAELAASRTSLDRSAADHQRLTADLAARTALLAEREASIDRLAEEARSLDLKRVELEGELNALSTNHQSELRRAADLHAEQLRSLEQQARQSKLEAEQRERDFKAHVEKRDADMEARFAALAGKALSSSNDELLKVARQMFTAVQQQGAAELEKRATAVDTLVKPIGETLEKTRAKLESLEKTWAADKGAITEQLRTVNHTSDLLRAETGKLVKALREPHVRGRYGEIQLKRIVELAGMSAFCDFSTQQSTRDGDGNLLRPDLIVNLPNGRHLVIDAKTNFQAYLDAQQADSADESTAQLDRFARHVAEQASALSKKKYWSQYDGAPEFTVMFLPHDAFLDAALARRPELLEQAWSGSVLFATPSSLIALLRAIHVGYQEQQLAKEARALFALGKELHERAAIAFEKVEAVGAAIGKASEKYNEFVGSYTRRLQPTLQKFEDAGVRSAKNLPEFNTLAVEPKRLPGLEAATNDGVAG